MIVTERKNTDKNIRRKIYIQTVIHVFLTTPLSSVTYYGLFTLPDMDSHPKNGYSIDLDLDQNPSPCNGNSFCTVQSRSWI